MDHFRALVRLAGEAGVKAQVYIYATRSTKAGSEDRDGVTLHHLRPAISTVIETSVTRCETSAAVGENACGVYVGVCGVCASNLPKGAELTISPAI